MVPKWGALPEDAPVAHREAWSRAWAQAPGRLGGGSNASYSTTERIHKMLLALVGDPECPPELIGETITAHVTEGRGAPDGVGPRGRLLLMCLRRNLWRSSWFPASLTALMESDREITRDLRVELAIELLSRGRLEAGLRPLVMAVSLLARTQTKSAQVRAHLSQLLAAPDADRASAEHLFRLLRRPGWFQVRPEGFKQSANLDESTRSSLRRSKPIHLPITAACVLAVDDLKARDSSLRSDAVPLARVAEGTSSEPWVQPRLPKLD